MELTVGDLLFGFFFLIGLAVYLGAVSFCVSYGWHRGRGDR